jgi:hypothetical protein
MRHGSDRNRMEDVTTRAERERARSVQVFAKLLDRLAEWVPVQSLRFSPEDHQGSICLFQGKNGQGQDRFVSLDIFLRPEMEGQRTNGRDIPFLLMDVGSQPAMGMRYDSLEQTMNQLLPSRERFMALMAERGVIFRVPRESGSVGVKARGQARLRAQNDSDRSR